MVRGREGRHTQRCQIRPHASNKHTTQRTQRTRQQNSNYIACDVGALFEAAGFEPRRKYLASASKAWTFVKRGGGGGGDTAAGDSPAGGGAGEGFSATAAAAAAAAAGGSAAPPPAAPEQQRQEGEGGGGEEGAGGARGRGNSDPRWN